MDSKSVIKGLNKGRVNNNNRSFPSVLNELSELEDILINVSHSVNFFKNICIDEIRETEGNIIIPLGYSRSILQSGEVTYVRNIKIFIPNRNVKNANIFECMSVEFIDSNNSKKLVGHININQDLDNDVSIVEYAINAAVLDITVNSLRNPLILSGIECYGVVISDIENEIGTIVGFREKQTPRVEYLLDRVQRTKESITSEIAANTEKLINIQDEYKSRSDKLKELEGLSNNVELELATRQATLIRVDAEVKEAQSELAKLQAQHGTERQEIKSKEEESHYIKMQIEDMLVECARESDRLDSLKKKASLYGEDFISVKDEYQEQNGIYMAMLVVLFFVGVCVFRGMYNAALDVVVNHVKDNADGLLGIFLNRLPLVLLNVLAAGVVIKLSMIFVGKLLDNHRVLSDLKQIAYLVRESVEEHSEDYKNCTSDDRMKIRTKMKTELVREYLSMRHNHSISKADTSSDSILSFTSLTKGIDEIKNMLGNK